MAVNLVMTIILLLVHEITLTLGEACLLLSAIKEYLQGTRCGVFKEKKIFCMDR